MSLTAIKRELYNVENGIQGVVRAYPDLPKAGPLPPDLPALINLPATPWLTFNFVSVAEIYYQWNYDVTLLYKVSGTGTVEEWDDGLEPFPARIVAALLGHLTLNQTCADQNWRANPRLIYNYQYLGETYVAWVLPWQINELVPTTIAA